ncbi:STAS domain-containing protein [Terricaulis sp.]|uniref:STAS domain-containing protein n=1 Tax=Terricaulis sp. TaxID=2768686 RepID=UPI003784E302
MRLPAILDLSAAAPLLAGVTAHRGEAIEIDASGVERIGGVCLQVLLAANAAWFKDGQDFAIVNPSAGFLSAVRLMGAGEKLGLGEAA